MIKNKPTFGIIGGSGLYDIKNLRNYEWTSVSTPFGKPSDKILKAKFKELEIFFYQGMEEITIYLRTKLTFEPMYLH